MSCRHSKEIIQKELAVSPYHVEAKALKLVLSLAATNNSRKLFVLYDYLSLVKAFNDQEEAPGKLNH